MFKSISLLISVLVLLSGCASIVSKSQYPVAIKSSPAGANFVIKNKLGEEIHNGRTPATITLDASKGYFSKASYTIEYSKKGYPTKTVNLTPTIDGWYIGNIAFGGLIGWIIVDPLTGAMFKLPKDVSADLGNDKSASNTNKLNVMSITELNSEQRKQLIALN